MAYGKFKMGRGDGRKTIQPVKPKDEMEGPRKGGGRMWTGGTPNFDERTGEYRDGRGTAPRTPKPGNLIRKRPPTPVGGGRVKPIAPKLPGRGGGRKTIQPVPPKGKKRSLRNDIIRNRRRPVGTK